MPGSLGSVNDIRFITAYVADPERNAVRAMIKANYGHGSKNPAENARRHAHRIVRRPHVMAKIKQLEAILSKECAVTVEMLSVGLRDAWLRAKAEGQIKHEITAINSLAKLHGFLVDKREDVTPFKGWTADELAEVKSAIAAERAARDDSGGDRSIH